MWSSNRSDGRYEVYRMRADGSDVVRLTDSGGMVPAWSPDGLWISYYCPSDSYVHVMHWDGSGDRQLCHRGPLDQGIPAFWMHDGTGLVCANLKGEDMEFYLADPATCRIELMFRKNDFDHLESTRFEPGGITHDGSWMVGWAYSLYDGGYQGDNGFFDAGQATVILDLDDKSKVYFFGPGCQSATPPAGEWIYHVSREFPTVPDIARMRVADVMTRESYQLELANEDPQWGHEYMPSISNDNNWMVYGATTGCHDLYDCDYEIFIHQLGAGLNQRTRLTDNPSGDNFPGIHVGELPVLPDGEDATCGVDSDEEYSDGDNGDSKEEVGNGCGCGFPSNSGLLMLVLLAVCLRKRG